MTVEGIPDGVDGQFGRVAVAAEMTEDNMAQRRGAGAEGEVGGGAVGEVSVGGHDALFDGKRTFGVCLEHLLVVVGLDEEAVDAGDVVNDGVVDVAQVGQHADGDGLAADGESDGIRGVVGDGKSGDFKRFEAERAAGAEEAPLGGGIALVLRADFVGGEACSVDRAAQSAKQDRKAGGMVAVFVGEQDGADLGRIETRGIEALEGLAGAETGVDEDGTVVRAEDGGVAATAAAEHDEFHAAERSGRDGRAQIRFVFRSWPSRRRMR